MAGGRLLPLSRIRYPWTESELHISFNQHGVNSDVRDLYPAGALEAPTSRCHGP